MKCSNCDTELIWGGDHDYDDCSCEGEGIVSNLSCPNDDCNVHLVLVYQGDDESYESAVIDLLNFVRSVVKDQKADYQLELYW